MRLFALATALLLGVASQAMAEEHVEKHLPTDQPAPLGVPVHDDAALAALTQQNAMLIQIYTMQTRILEELRNDIARSQQTTQSH